MARRRLTAKANSNRDPRGDVQIALLVGDGLPALRNNCVHEPFCLRATLYAYRWPGAAPASTPCPREGAGPCSISQGWRECLIGSNPSGVSAGRRLDKIANRLK